MPKRTVQIMVEEYLSLADRRGLLYDRSSCRDAQKEKELRKKAHTIFEAFLKDCDYKDDSILRKNIGEDIWLSLRDVICTMKRKSGEEYLILNDFFAFLWDRCRVEIKHFDRQLTSLERQLSIAKDMHDFNQATSSKYSYHSSVSWLSATILSVKAQAYLSSFDVSFCTMFSFIPMLLPKPDCQSRRIQIQSRNK